MTSVSGYKKNKENSETPRRVKQGEDRNQERFGEVMLYSEKHRHDGKAQGQIETHHEDVQDCELRGQEIFEWSTDVIETKKLENCTCRVAQDL